MPFFGFDRRERFFREGFRRRRVFFPFFIEIDRRRRFEFEEEDVDSIKQRFKQYYYELADRASCHQRQLFINPVQLKKSH